MNRSHLVTIAVLLAILLIAGLVTTYIVKKQKNEINQQTKTIFADTDDSIAYTDINGNQISLEQYLGRVLVVTSWASWSPFSKDQLEALAQLSGNYDQSQVVFLAINRKETREQAQRYANTIQNTGSVLIVLDPRDNFYTSIQGYAMPETVIYNSRGDIIEQIRGTFNQEQIQNLIETARNTTTS